MSAALSKGAPGAWAVGEPGSVKENRGGGNALGPETSRSRAAGPAAAGAAVGPPSGPPIVGVAIAAGLGFWGSIGILGGSADGHSPNRTDGGEAGAGAHAVPGAAGGAPIGAPTPACSGPSTDRMTLSTTAFARGDGRPLCGPPARRRGSTGVCAPRTFGSRKDRY